MATPCTLAYTVTLEPKPGVVYKTDTWPLAFVTPPEVANDPAAPLSEDTTDTPESRLPFASSNVKVTVVVPEAESVGALVPGTARAAEVRRRGARRRDVETVALAA